jgi:hypothetical protein
LKMQLLQDVYSIVIPPNWYKDPKHGTNTCKEKQVGFYTLLYDEAAQEDEKATKGKKAAPKKLISAPLIWK